MNFAKFYELEPGSSTDKCIDKHSLTVVGWATAYVADDEELDRRWANRDDHSLVGGCALQQDSETV